MRIFRLIAVFSVAAAHVVCNTARAEMPMPEDGTKFSVGGYSSAGILFNAGGRTEAALNEVSLIFNWDALDRLKIFSEIEVEKPLTWHENANATTGNAYFDVERLYADYSLNGKLNVRAGRFLSPIGRWNLIHADPLVWTSLRPAATQRLFPLAVNGVMLHGAAPWGEAGIEYSAYVEAVPDQTEDPDEIPFQHMRGARVAYNGLAEVGLSLAEFEEDWRNHPRYRLLGMDFFKSWNGWEVSGELYQRFAQDHQRDGGGGHLQGVAPLGNRWFAVGRLENLREPERGDRFSGTTGRWLLGAAWRQSNTQVFKLEYVGGSDPHPDMPRGFVASYAILF